MKGSVGPNFIKLLFCESKVDLMKHFGFNFCMPVHVQYIYIVVNNYQFCLSQISVVMIFLARDRNSRDTDPLTKARILTL